MEEVQMEQGDDRKEKLLAARPTLKKGLFPVTNNAYIIKSCIYNLKTGIRMKQVSNIRNNLKNVSLKKE
jgi:hypothetical protein